MKYTLRPEGARNQFFRYDCLLKGAVDKLVNSIEEGKNNPREFNNLFINLISNLEKYGGKNTVYVKEGVRYVATAIQSESGFIKFFTKDVREGKVFDIEMFNEPSKKYIIKYKKGEYVVEKKSMTRYPNNFRALNGTMFKNTREQLLKEGKIKGTYVSPNEYVELVDAKGKDLADLGDLQLDSGLKGAGHYLTLEDLSLTLRKRDLELKVKEGRVLSLESEWALGDYFTKYLGITPQKFVYKVQDKDGRQFLVAFFGSELLEIYY